MMIFYFLATVSLLVIFFAGFLCGRYILITKYQELANTYENSVKDKKEEINTKIEELRNKGRIVLETIDRKQEDVTISMVEMKKAYAEFIPLLQRFRVIVETYPENKDKPNVDQFFRSFSTCYGTFSVPNYTTQVFMPGTGDVPYNNPRS